MLSIRKSIINRTILFIGLFLFVGFVCRLYLSGLSNNMIGSGWDTDAYNNMASEMLSGLWGVDGRNHNSGYSFVLFLIYSFFGRGNFQAVRIIQIIIDLTCALLIYFTAVRIFNKRAAFTSFGLYLFNPFTASYTGMLLPEIFTLFYIILIAYLVTVTSFTRSKLLWLFVGFMLGVLLFTRMSFYYFAFGFILAFALVFFRGIDKIHFVCVALFGLVLASSYSLLGNYHKHKVFSLVPPYNLGLSLVYLNFYQARYPELSKDIPSGFDPKFDEIILEYHRTNYRQIPNFRKKYTILLFQKLKTEWPIFLKIIIRNIFLMWDKEHLAAYTDPFYPKDIWPLRILNVCIFALFLVGLIFSILKEKIRERGKPLLFYTVFLFLYITLFFPFVTNETRHTLPFYPIFFLFAGIGLYKITDYLSHHLKLFTKVSI